MTVLIQLWPCWAGEAVILVKPALGGLAQPHHLFTLSPAPQSSPPALSSWQAVQGPWEQAEGPGGR